MSGRIRHRAGRLLAAAGLLLTGLPGVLTAQPAGAAPAPAPVQVTVLSVSPPVPAPSQGYNPLSITFTLRNTSDVSYTDVQLTGVRGAQLTTEASLTAALSAPGGDSGNAIKEIPAPKPISLPAEGSATVVFGTQTSIANVGQGICLCVSAGVYPLYFTVAGNDPDGTQQVLGTATTFLPAAYAKPATTVQVAWLWPLLDVPHRLTDGTVFTDDRLAAEVSPGGRLARALDVVQQVPNVPITLLVDPELLDELEVMATGRYTVVVNGHSTPGTGQAAAAAWLNELQAVLTTNTALQVQLTPYADPDLQALHHAQLHWSAKLPADMAARVASALAGRPLDGTLAWPAGGTYSQGTLNAVAASGVSKVVLTSNYVTPHQDGDKVPTPVAQLTADGRGISALLVDPTLHSQVAKAVTTGGQAALPTLVSELAVQVAQEPDKAHGALLVPPRYVDPDVTAAAAAINATSTSTFTSATSAQALATGALLPRTAGKLAPAPVAAAQLSHPILDVARQLGTLNPAVQSMLRGSGVAAAALVAGLPGALQRVESSAWQGLDADDAGLAFADQALAVVTPITSGRHLYIVQPSSGTYTLASSNSPLPITVENDLPYPVTVQVQVSTANGLPGFHATQTQQEIDAGTKRTLRLPTKIDRSGRIQVAAVLLAPDGTPIGQPVALTVHSTALGVVGVVITMVAGAVLALALLVRLIRRLQARRRRRARLAAAEPAAVPAAAAPEAGP